MRFAADNLDADVQQFMAQGVRILDRAKKELPVGLSGSHEQARDRCHMLANSMEKVLQKRLTDPAVKAWDYVKVNATAVTVKQPGQTALSVEKTVQTVKDIARGHFEGSAWKAGMAQRTYHLWARNAEEHAEKTGMYPPDARRRAVLARLYDASRRAPGGVRASGPALGACRCQRRHRLFAGDELRGDIPAATAAEDVTMARPVRKQFKSANEGTDPCRRANDEALLKKAQDTVRVKQEVSRQNLLHLQGLEIKHLENERKFIGRRRRRTFRPSTTRKSPRSTNATTASFTGWSAGITALSARWRAFLAVISASKGR